MTGSRITLDTARLTNFTDRMLDQIYLIFHNHGLSFDPKEPLSPDELSRMGFNQSQAQYYYEHTEQPADPDETFHRNNPKWNHITRTGR